MSTLIEPDFNSETAAEAADQRKTTSLFSVLSAALGNIVWGFSYLFTRLALQDTAPDILLSIRFLSAFLLMNLLILLKKGRVSFRGKKLRSIILLAILEPLYFYFESYGILYTNATFAGVVLAIVPVVSILFAVLFLKEYPTRRQTVFCIFPVIGVILMVLAGSSLGIIQPIGVVFLLGSCLTSAAYKTVNRKSAEEFTSFERTYIVLLISCIVFTTAALITTRGELHAWLTPLTHTTTLFAIFMLSAFCSVGANLLVNYAAGHLAVVKLSSFGALTTLCSMVAGIIFLHEPFSWTGGIGAVFILIGIWQVTKLQQ